MSTYRFTEADRDARGFIRVTPPAPAPDPEPRSLADLLPPIAPAAAPVAPPPPAIPVRAQLAAGVVAALAVIFVAFYAFGRSEEVAPAATPAAVRASAAPSAASAAMPPTAAASVEQPTPRPSQSTLARTVGAFAAPEGQYLGIIEAGRSYRAVGRLGDAWTQIDAQGSGKVWIKASELAPDAALPDLATPTPRPLPTSPPAPAYQAPPPPPPPPTHCVTVGAAGSQPATACGYEDPAALEAQAKAQYIAQNKLVIAIVGTPSPQPIP